MGDEEEELLGIWGITKSWSLDIDLCNGPFGAVIFSVEDPWFLYVLCLLLSPKS